MTDDDARPKTATLSLCTWTPDCPRDGEQRFENPSMGGGSVEFVCPTHAVAARAAGYRSSATPESDPFHAGAQDRAAPREAIGRAGDSPVRPTGGSDGSGDS